MDLRIAIDLAGGGLQNLGAAALRESEHVDCAVNAGLRGLDWIVLIVNRRCRTRQIVDLVNLDVEWECDVMPEKLEILVLRKVKDVSSATRVKVIDADHVVTFAN